MAVCHYSGYILFWIFLSEVCLGCLDLFCNNCFMWQVYQSYVFSVTCLKTDCYLLHFRHEQRYLISGESVLDLRCTFTICIELHHYTRFLHLAEFDTKLLFQ